MKSGPIDPQRALSRRMIPAALLLLSVFSCKTSSDKGSPSVPGPAPFDTPDPSSPSGGQQAVQPPGLAPESTPWFSMRNDCRGTSSTQWLDLYLVGTSGKLNYSYIDFVVGHDSFQTGSGTSGPAQNPTQPQGCAVIQAYFTALSDVWQGRDYLDVFKKGESVSFSPTFDFNYRGSIKISGMNDFTAAMASSKQFEADTVAATISYTVERGSKGIVLVDDIPVTIQCAQKLNYQLYTYRTTLPENAEEAKYCRTVPRDAQGRNAECLAVDEWTCKQSRDSSGQCPSAKINPTLDSCSYLIPNLPLVNFAGDTIGTAKVGGFLFKTSNKVNAEKLAYRMTLNRVEITPAQP